MQRDEDDSSGRRHLGRFRRVLYRIYRCSYGLGVRRERGGEVRGPNYTSHAATTLRGQRMINKNVFVRVMSTRSISAYHWCRTEHRSRPNHRGLKGEGYKYGVRLVRSTSGPEVSPSLSGYRVPIYSSSLSGSTDTHQGVIREGQYVAWLSDVYDEGYPDVSLRMVRGTT
jgi:hypothetical protein